MSEPAPSQRRRGLAMLEILIAVGILSLSVSSITTAIVAGQQLGIEAREKVVGTVAAESLMAQLLQEPWASLGSWDGYEEQCGTIADPKGKLVGGDWDRIGRLVKVSDQQIKIESLKIIVNGRKVIVSSFDKNNRILATVEQFVPEFQ